MLGRATMSVALALLMAAVLAGPAYAESELVSQSVTHVTGAEVVASTLADIQRVEIGSSVTTVTLQEDSAAAPVIVDYSDLLGTSGGTGGGSGGAIGPLLTLSVGVVALRSVLRLLRSVGRLGSTARGR
jgi:hypothetical protein